MTGDWTYKHSTSGAVALVTMRGGSTSGVRVTLECLSDPRQTTDPETFPFRVSMTNTLQPCCELQGSASGYYGGDCPIHGKPFYLTRYSTEPLSISAEQLEAEWVRE